MQNARDPSIRHVDHARWTDIQGSTRTALLEAMGCGNVQVAKYLIENGANLEARDEVHDSLFRVGYYRHFVVLKKVAARVCTQNDDTALTYAAQAGELAMVELLLEHGADITATGFVRASATAFLRPHKQCPLIALVPSAERRNRAVPSHRERPL
jgi:hypothetical protein